MYGSIQDIPVHMYGSIQEMLVKQSYLSPWFQRWSHGNLEKILLLSKGPIISVKVKYKKHST